MPSGAQAAEHSECTAPKCRGGGEPAQEIVWVERMGLSMLVEQLL